MDSSNNKIFRKKSLDKVSSVDDLDKYIKTTTPSLWLLLASIIVLLVGVISWATIGKINVESTVGCFVENNKIICIVSEDRIENLTDDSFIEINGKKITITKVVGPIQDVDDSRDALLHISNIENGSWYYEVIGNCDLEDGTYKGKVVFEQMNPITFIIN